MFCMKYDVTLWVFVDGLSQSLHAQELGSAFAFWHQETFAPLCFQAMPNSTALIVNHENITRCFYRGADPSFLLAGALFRVGGAAALISNRRATLCHHAAFTAPAFTAHAMHRDDASAGGRLCACHTACLAY